MGATSVSPERPLAKTKSARTRFAPLSAATDNNKGDTDMTAAQIAADTFLARALAELIAKGIDETRAITIIRNTYGN